MKIKSSFTNLTIVSIGLIDDEGMLDTYNSIKEILKLGAKWNLILSTCQGALNNIQYNKLIVGKDTGLYNALNLGIASVDTEYFMFLHCGDCIIQDKFKAFWFSRASVDLNLGGALIGNRRHLSRYWQPWMLDLYVQPPHLPILYKTEIVNGVSFREDIPVVADYYMINMLFRKNPTWRHSDMVFIKMNAGGLTTSGLKSVLVVTMNFFRVDGIKALILAPVRLLIKSILK